MITINIRFYDKKTEFIVDAKKIDAPYDLVLAAAEEDELSISQSYSGPRPWRPMKSYSY